MNEVGTQTARPKTSLSFATFPCRNGNETQRVYGSVEDNITQNAQSLQAQVQDIKRLEEQLRKNKVQLEEGKKSTKETGSDRQELEFSDDSILSDDEKANNDDKRKGRYTSENRCDALTSECPENFLNAPTLTSWTGFDSNGDDDEYDLPELPRRNVSEGVAPWQNFKDILIGNR